VYNLRNRLLGHINDKVRVCRRLVDIIHSREVLEIACVRTSIDALTVRLLAVFERGGHMHEEEVTRATRVDNSIACRCAALLVWRHGSSNDRRACARELGRHPRDALQVLMSVLSGVPELRAVLLADGLALEERDRAAALLVQYNL
jgi:hypothetical protein